MGDFFTENRDPIPPRRHLSICKDLARAVSLILIWNELKMIFCNPFHRFYKKLLRMQCIEIYEISGIYWEETSPAAKHLREKNR